jgi:hypothetical protein
MSLAVLILNNGSLVGQYVSRDVLREAMNSAFSTGSLEEAAGLMIDCGTFYDPDENDEGDDIFIDVESGDPMDFVEDVWNVLTSDAVSQIMMGQEH